MTFAAADYKEVGGPGNNIDGGQVHSCHSSTDSLATMMASGYLNAIEAKLKTDDIALLSGSDGAKLVQVVNTAGVITTVSVESSGAAQSISGPGAIDIVTPVTEVTSTGADALTIADGAIGQRKRIILIVDGGTATLTPANGLGYTTIAFADAGDSVDLEFRTGGWAMIGHGGLAGGPVAA